MGRGRRTRRRRAEKTEGGRRGPAAAEAREEQLQSRRIRSGERWWGNDGARAAADPLVRRRGARAIGDSGLILKEVRDFFAITKRFSQFHLKRECGFNYQKAQGLFL